MTPDSRIGTELAGYRIEAKVGQGGMGVVYRAEQTRLGRKVALKVLTPELAENEGFRERFERESRLAAAIDHPNIVPLYEAGETDGLLFITMRYVEGTDLKALIERTHGLSLSRALAVAGQVASALDTAHAGGLVHRDVKPGNILVAEGAAADGGDHCYLTDFGLTKDTSSPVELTATGTFVGTLDYVAPEQIEGTAPDGRSDQYALCCVLWECLVGKPPFVRDAEIAVMWAHLQDRPPRLSEARPGLPAGLDDVIAKAMEKAPADRYATCVEFIAAARAQTAGVAPAAGQTAVRAAAPAPGAATTVRGTPADAPRAAPAPGAVPAPGPLPAGAVTAPGAAPPLAPAAGATVAGRGRAEQPAAATDAAASRPAAAERGRPARGLAALALGVVVVLAAIAGAVVGGSGGSGGDSATPAPAVRAGTLSLMPAEGWQATARAAAIPGLALRKPVALTGSAAGLSAGPLARPGAALLPDAFVARLPGGRAPQGEGVALGSAEALRFAGLRVRGVADALTIYIVPTESGAVAVACRAPDAATLTRSGCDGVAATLRLSGERSLEVAPSPAYASRLGAVLGSLESSRKRGRATLSAAKTSRGQVTAAKGLRVSYGRIARRAKQLKAPPLARRAHAQIVAALGDARDGYGRLASAAGDQSAGRYSAATRAVARAESHLAAAVAALAALGYEVAR